MKKQTGWAICPMCEGSGKQQTKKTKEKVSSSMAESQSFGVRIALAPEKEERNKLIEKLFVRDPIEFKYEPCSTCGKSKFKGLLPIY